MSVLLLIFIQIIEYVYRVIKGSDSSIYGTGSNNHYIHDRLEVTTDHIQLPGSVQKPELYGDKKKFHVRLESRRRNFDKL